MIKYNALSLFLLENDQNIVCNRNLCPIQDFMCSDDMEAPISNMYAQIFQTFLYILRAPFQERSKFYLVTRPLVTIPLGKPSLPLTSWDPLSFRKLSPLTLSTSSPATVIRSASQSKRSSFVTPSAI